MAKKIFFGNYKGGVGKTTSVFQIGINLAQKHNKKVLLLDLDPQASLSRICTRLTNTRLENIVVEKTLNYLLELYTLSYRRYSKLDILKNDIDVNLYNILKNAIFQSSSCENLYFIPTRMDITNARINDISDQISRYSTGVVGVAKIIDDLEDDFEYILIDCPPSLNSVIQAVFLKSDFYLIPTIADDMSSAGVIDYIKIIDKTFLQYTYDSSIGGILLEKVFGKKTKLLGILETLHNTASIEYTNTKLYSLNTQLSQNNIELFEKSREYMMEIPNASNNYIFNTKIRHLNNMSNPKFYGIPEKTANAQLHDEYDTIASNIINILQD